MCPYVCVGVQLSHIALGNLMSPPLFWGRKQRLVAGITYTRSPTSTQTNRLTDRLISDIIRKWKHWVLLYGLHSVITHIQLHTVLAHKNLHKLSILCFFFFKVGRVLDLIINYSEGPALANQTKPWILFSYEQLWWVLCVCLEGKAPWRPAWQLAWWRSSAVAWCSKDPWCDPGQVIIDASVTGHCIHCCITQSNWFRVVVCVCVCRCLYEQRWVIVLATVRTSSIYTHCGRQSEGVNEREWET